MVEAEKTSPTPTFVPEPSNEAKIISLKALKEKIIPHLLIIEREALQVDYHI